MNARHNLVQFKVIHRLHYSKVKLHKIFPDTSPLCETFKQEEGTLTHLFWTYPKLHVYWALIFDYLSKAIDRVIAPDPLIALIQFDTVDGNNQEGKAVSLCTLLAKRLILQFWKLETVPTF